MVVFMLLFIAISVMILLWRSSPFFRKTVKSIPHGIAWLMSAIIYCVLFVLFSVIVIMFFIFFGLGFFVQEFMTGIMSAMTSIIKKAPLS